MTQTVFNDRPVSKVLVLDNSATASDVIKQFCSDNDLVALKVRKDALLAVLRTNIDQSGRCPVFGRQRRYGGRDRAHCISNPRRAPRAAYRYPPQPRGDAR